MKKAYWGLFTLLLLCVPVVCVAQAASEPDSTVTHADESPIEIVGEAIEQSPIEQQRLNNPVPNSGVDRKTFVERPATRRLGDVINRLPGVYMGGAPGENKDIRLRGLDKEYTRFEVDGVQLPGAGEKREFQVNRLSPLWVGVLTVIKNSTAEYESDGIAGRVIAEPRPVPEEWRLDTRVGLGGIDEFDGSLLSGGVSAGRMLTDTFGFNAVYDFVRQPFEKNTTTQVYDGGELKATNTENESKPSDSHNLMLDMVWKYDSGAFHLKPMLFFLEEEKNKRKLKEETGKDPQLELEDEQKDQATYGLGLSHEHNFGGGARVESDLGYYLTRETKDKTKEVLKDQGAGYALDKTEIEAEKKEDDFWETKSKLIVPHELVVPGEFRSGVHLRFRERFRAKDKLEVKPDGSITQKGEAKDDYSINETLVMGFVQNEFFLADRFSMLPGVRVEHTIQKVESGAGADDSRSFTDVNPSLHFLFRKTEAISLKAAASRGLNRPKFDELSPYVEEKGDRFVMGNPDLDPARSWNSDLGLDYATPRLFLGFNLFNKNIADVVEEVDTGTDIDGKDVYRVENVGDGYIRGIELEQRVAVGKLVHPSLNGLSLWANESFFDSELTDDSGQKRPFNEQPVWIGNFGVDYHFAPTRTTVTAATQYRSSLEKTKADNEWESEEALWTLDLGVRQKMGEHWKLVLEVLNVTDAGKEKTKYKGSTIERELGSTGRMLFASIEATF